MIIDVKTKFYNIIKDLGYTIYDNPYTIDGQRRHLPYCQIKTNNIKRTMFQQKPFDMQIIKSLKHFGDGRNGDIRERVHGG